MENVAGILGLYALALVLTVLFAAKRWTKWSSLLLVAVIGPFGFLWVLWDAWRATDRSTPPFAKVHDWSALFDRERFGLAYPVGVLLFIAMVLGRTLSTAHAHLWGFDFPFLSPADQVVFASRDLLWAFAFVFACHAVRNTRALPWIWGAVVAVLGLVTGAVRMALPNAPAMPFPAWGSLLLSFVGGLLFMGALILAVRRWGARLKSMTLGVALAALATGILGLVYTRVAFGGVDGAYVLFSIIDDVLFGCAEGALLYAGVFVYLRKRAHLLTPVIITCVESRNGAAIPVREEGGPSDVRA